MNRGSEDFHIEDMNVKALGSGGDCGKAIPSR